MTVGELEERMSSLEFAGWMAFDQVEYEDRPKS